jgi:hypothetical protein
VNAPEALEEIRSLMEGLSFPCPSLEGCESALVLFAAGFYGKQDAFWIADAGIHATCVDLDHEKLDEMAAVYPTDWDFLEADAYTWADTATGKWDVVTVDCPSGHFARCADRVALWCHLANRLVVLGAGRHQREAIEAPEGWAVTDVRRRSGYDGGV